MEKYCKNCHRNDSEPDDFDCEKAMKSGDIISWTKWACEKGINVTRRYKMKKMSEGVYACPNCNNVKGFPDE
ncbi:hypothetical protein LCGC14_2010650 [marine sediment metagenome]|uniref:Uncharacterized protein n=1 Tax=marine sediment metagenome TaxID=412755 RepID=A0A0F9HXN1_9ZZZZ